ncbi:MAG: molybdenum cofactor biosynthesis protein MoaE [Saprospiraceae bacterium]|nr:molybdenum cofactor biosynthesis protein MoaE [Saprospiraceae bacterium]
MRHNIQLFDQPLDPALARQQVEDPSCGGVVLFVGNVRNATQGKEVLRLEFESYRPMALREMEKIAIESLERFRIHKMSIHHRLGTLQIGESAVIIAVSAPHRKAAFKACAYAIDTLKETVPIWKKEIFSDGEVWVAATP